MLVQIGLRIGTFTALESVLLTSGFEYNLSSDTADVISSLASVGLHAAVELLTITESASIEADFDRQVRLSMKDLTSDRLARLAVAPAKPSRREVKVIVFERNPDVVAQVLLEANGRCKSCCRRAPFTRRKDGSPYLEVHHRKRLIDGGDDTVENAIALCPNCRRAAHYG